MNQLSINQQRTAAAISATVPTPMKGKYANIKNPIMKTNILTITRRRQPITCVAFTLLALTAGSANGQGTIISVTGPADMTRQWSGGLGVNDNLQGVSWITTSAITNVRISVDLAGDSGATGEAFLTTQIGPGTTTANQIATASFSFPAIDSFTTVLSGLNLSAGTNYLPHLMLSGRSEAPGLRPAKLAASASA